MSDNRVQRTWGADDHMDCVAGLRGSQMINA